MTLSSIYTMLTSITGFSGKVSYRAFPAGSAPALPYIVYLCGYSDNFAADDQVYVPIEHITIELYSERKDEASEALVEGALNRAGLVWEKSEEQIDSELMLEVVYEINIMKG